jgi:hypothetical protein
VETRKAEGKTKTQESVISGKMRKRVLQKGGRENSIEC